METIKTGNSAFPYKYVWKAIAPLKIRAFLRQAVWEKLNTLDWVQGR